MTLIEKVEDWKKYPNALGSESHAAIVVGEVAAAWGEDIPDAVNSALRSLSLRGTMRDIASTIQRNEEYLPRHLGPSFHDVVDSAAASCGLSWAEALAIIAKHLDEQVKKIAQ